MGKRYCRTTIFAGKVLNVVLLSDWQVYVVNLKDYTPGETVLSKTYSIIMGTLPRHGLHRRMEWQMREDVALGFRLMRPYSCK